MTLPIGHVTFLLSDIEGSTRLAQRLGDDGWADLGERTQALLDEGRAMPLDDALELARAVAAPR